MRQNPLDATASSGLSRHNFSRLVLNHTAPKSDVLHRHDVSLGVSDVAAAIVQIQEALTSLMRNDHQEV